MPELLTMQDLANGHLDVKALGDAANGDENTIVTTRTGNTYPSAERAIKTLFENGGLPATPFASKALMTASALVDGKYAMVTDDTVNNGLYVKTAGAWVKSGYDPIQESDFTYQYLNGNLYNPNVVKQYKDYVVSGVEGTVKAKLGASISLVPVIAGTTYYMHNKKGYFYASASYGIFSDDPVLNPALTSLAHTSVGFTVAGLTGKCLQFTAPVGAKYLVFHHLYGGEDLEQVVRLDDNLTDRAVGEKVIAAINNTRFSVSNKESENSGVPNNVGINRFVGKRIIALGDSITQGTEGGYVKYIEELTGCTILNRAMSGASSNRVYDMALAGLGLVKRDGPTESQVFPAVDYTVASAVFIMIGTNDSAHLIQYGRYGDIKTIPKGHISNAADVKTYLESFPVNYTGNLGAVIEYIKWKNPEIEIHIINPPFLSRNIEDPESENYETGQTMKFVPFIKDICTYYGCHFIPSHESGISYKGMNSTQGQYTYDGTHFNELGNRVFGRYVAQKILYMG